MIKQQQPKRKAPATRLRILEDILSGVKATLAPGQDGDLIEEMDRELYEQDKKVLERWIQELKGGRALELTVPEISDRIDLLDTEILCWDQVLEEDTTLSEKDRKDILERRHEARGWKKELKAARSANKAARSRPDVSQGQPR